MKRIVILVSVILLLTGCSVKYQVMIDDNLKVIENAKIMGDASLYESYYRTTKYNVLKDMLERFTNQLTSNQYEYELKDEVNPYIVLNKEYTSIDEYLNNSLLFNDYFDKINYVLEDDKIIIETEGFHPNNANVPDRFFVDELAILISSKYQILSSNATKVDKDRNIHYFYLDRDTTDFKIMLEISTNKPFIANRGRIWFIAISILIILVVWIVIIYKNKKGKDNGYEIKDAF